MNKKFYLVSFYTMSDCRAAKLYYTASSAIAESLARRDCDFAQMIGSRLINNPVTECGYFPEYIAELVAKG